MSWLVNTACQQLSPDELEYTKSSFMPARRTFAPKRTLRPLKFIVPLHCCLLFGDKLSACAFRDSYSSTSTGQFGGFGGPY